MGITSVGKTKSRIALILFVLGTALPGTAAAASTGNNNTPPPKQEEQHPALKSEVGKYLSKTLHVENFEDYHLTYKFHKRLEKFPDASRESLSRFFSEQSAPILGKIFRAFGRTQYNNAIALGPAGVGKSYLTDQLALLFSYGIYPEFLEKELGIRPGTGEMPFEILREAFLGNTDIILVNLNLLSHDNTRSGKAFSSENVRMAGVLTDLFNAAKADFRRPRDHAVPGGRRTLFLFDEVATLPPIVQATLKKVLDESGFKNPLDPIMKETDPGYMIMAMTTPDEFRDMVKGDSAIERRYAKIQLLEPTEEEAFRILRNQSDKEWTPLYGLEITDEALRFLIRMRRFMDSPPLAMPASVLKAANDLYLSAMNDPAQDSVIDLRAAQEFLMNNLGLTDLWFEGPNGEPPFADFAKRVKKLVVGQDAVVDKITSRIAAWARLGFGGDLPVFIIGGSSGSGKDTLLKALNEVMFGHDGKHLIYSIGGIGGFGINSIIEGPPLGNHNDSSQGLLVQALEQGPSTGILAFNEAKDAPTDQLEKLKVFIESGEIRPKGKDSRVRPLKFPIFIMGQWGEELFDGKTDEEIRQIYNALTQTQIEAKFLEGKDPERTVGAVSRAILDRAKKTGGVFLLKPVPRKLFPEIVKIHLTSSSKRFKTGANLDVEVSQELIQFITEISVLAGEGPRGLGATTVDFTETAISRAMDLGLRIRGTQVILGFQKNAAGREEITVTSGDQTWKLDAQELRRTKMCELTF